MGGASEHINESWGSIKCEKFRERLVAFLEKFYLLVLVSGRLLFIYVIAEYSF
jgi:hypothetical protein